VTAGLLRCLHCDAVIAERVGETYVIRHGRRRWLVRQIIDYTCPNRECPSNTEIAPPKKTC
jgi:hypothetical protein